MDSRTLVCRNSIACYYYGNSEAGELERDKNILQTLGFKVSSGTCGSKALRLRVLRPREFAKNIAPLVKHPEKKKKLLMLTKKRHYGA